MPNQMQAEIGYYDISKTIYDNDVEILVHKFDPDAKAKVRVKATGEITEIEAYLIFPHLHSVFLGDQEFNVRNRVSKYLGNGESEASREPVEESKAKGKDTTPSSKKSKSKASKRDGCD